MFSRNKRFIFLAKTLDLLRHYEYVTEKTLKQACGARMMPRLRLGRGGACVCAARCHPTRYERRAFISGTFHAAGRSGRTELGKIRRSIALRCRSPLPCCMGLDIEAPFMFSVSYFIMTTVLSIYAQGLEFIFLSKAAATN